MVIHIQTTIETVTVFRDGARITRRGRVRLKPGEQTIAVGDITGHAQEDSFRVKGKGNALLRGIDIRNITRLYVPDEPLEGLRKELRSLEMQQARIETRIQLQQKRIELLDNIAADFASSFGKWIATGESSFKQLELMDRTSLKHLVDAKKKIRILQDEQEEVEAKITALRNNIERIQGERRTESLREVLIVMEAKEETEVELEVSYQVSYAGWTPTYDVDLGENEASLRRIALVSNTSLENWSDVSLTVSTASARPVQAIKASPYYVDVSYLETASTTRTGGRLYKEDRTRALEREESFDEYIAEESAPMDDMTEAYADVSESASGIVIYEVPGKVTITSGDDPHPVTLIEETFLSKKIHYWNAYAMAEVVAQDEITNGDSLILPGSIKVYAEGDFIGESYIDTVSPRETFRIGTRASYDIKATKKLESKDTDKAGLTKGKTKREYRYRLELESFSKSPVTIRVVDRIPHSTSERIQVELGDVVPSPMKNELGVMEWVVSIEPEQKMSITYDFEVEWEKGIRIQPPLP